MLKKPQALFSGHGVAVAVVVMVVAMHGPGLTGPVIQLSSVVWAKSHKGMKS